MLKRGFLLSAIVIVLCTAFPYGPLYKTEENGCDICADVVFLFDDSSSIPMSDPMGYDKMKRFMISVTQSFTTFGPPSGVQVSVVLVAHNVQNYFFLNNFTDVTSIVDSIHKLEGRKGSATAIGEGLKFIKENSFQRQHGGGRACASKFVIMMTDGKYNMGTLPYPEARDLKANNVSIFSIGVGPNVLISELKMIASKPEFMFNVTDFSQLMTINKTIVADACREAEKTQPPKKSCNLEKSPNFGMKMGYVLLPILYPPFMVPNDDKPSADQDADQFLTRSNWPLFPGGFGNHVNHDHDQPRKTKIRKY